MKSCSDTGSSIGGDKSSLPVISQHAFGCRWREEVRGRRCSWEVPSWHLEALVYLRRAVWSKAEQKLTVCDAGQGLVEGGRVAVVGERDAHASGQKPPGQREGLLVQEEPGSEALVAHLLALQQQERRLIKQGHFSQLFPDTGVFFF